MPGSDVAARGRAPSNPIAIGRYALAWIAVVAVVVGLTVFVSSDPRAAPAADPVTLAAAEGGCVVRTDAGGASARDLDVMQPPTFGPPAAPAATGVYRHAPRTTAVTKRRKCVGLGRDTRLRCEREPQRGPGPLTVTSSRKPRARASLTMLS
jgi:hypothetical protein